MEEDYFDFDHHNYNSHYRNVVRYYNNYPVYSSIPASIPNSNNQAQNDGNYSKKNSKDTVKHKKHKGAIILNYNKADMCNYRPQEYAPGYVSAKP